MFLSTEIEPGPQRPGILGRVRHWWGPHPAVQVLVIAAVVALLALFAANTTATMARIGIQPGFDFLERSANFQIGESPIPFQAGDTYARAILAGFLNTVKVAALGCLLATVLGVALGIAGLSGNLLLGTLVRWYVEVVRNTPLLLQLFFWIALAKAFPPPRQALALVDAVFLSNRGVFVPAVRIEGGSALLLPGAFLAVAPVVVWAFRQRRKLTWRHVAAGGAVLAGVVGVLLAASGTSVLIDRPALAGFNIRGGTSLTPEFAALLIGLTVKFSAAIAEIVRAGIQSVGSGQWEAARALGLRNGAIMRLVVLPQALRVITPLTTSSYLDLFKDSSLAVAIGYPDLVSIIGTTANTTGQSFEALAILIGIYLAMNLSVSALMNLYNNRVVLRGAQGR